MILLERQICDRSRWFTEGEILAVTDHAYDLSPGSSRTVKADPAAYDFLAGKMALCKRLVNNYDARLIFCVLQIEVAPAQ